MEPEITAPCRGAGFTYTGYSTSSKIAPSTLYNNKRNAMRDNGSLNRHMTVHIAKLSSAYKWCSATMRSGLWHSAKAKVDTRKPSTPRAWPASIQTAITSASPMTGFMPSSRIRIAAKTKTSHNSNANAARNGSLPEKAPLSTISNPNSDRSKKCYGREACRGCGHLRHGSMHWFL